MSRRTALTMGGSAVIVLVAALIAVLVIDGGDDPSDVRTAAPSTTTEPSTTTAEPAGPVGEEPGSTTSDPGSPTTGGAPDTRGPGPTSAPPPSLSDVRVRLTEVARLTGPLAMATRRNDAALYVIQKTGQVIALADGGRTTVVDISGDLVEGSDDLSGANEQGLLGIAFSPDGDRLYLSYSDRDGDTALDEWRIDSDRRVSDRRRVLSVDQPHSNHNGGVITFGPDGLLYLGLGDGGAGGDPEGNAQDLSSLLGKILRIDPRPSGGASYRIPAGNPFVGRSGARGEIWSYGLRNPWRFSFDRQKGDLWIGDVGQAEVEEVDWAPQPNRGRGANFGWDLMEGNQSFEGSPPPDHAAPIHTYSRSGGRCAVTGGYVYRGARIPDLAGTYLFADFCAGEVMGLRPTPSGRAEVASLRISASKVASFGEGPDGELYVLSLDGPVLRIDPD